MNDWLEPVSSYWEKPAWKSFANCYKDFRAVSASPEAVRLRDVFRHVKVGPETKKSAVKSAIDDAFPSAGGEFQVLKFQLFTALELGVIHRLARVANQTADVWVCTWDISLPWCLREMGTKSGLEEEVVFYIIYLILAALGVTEMSADSVPIEVCETYEANPPKSEAANFQIQSIWQDEDDDDVW